MSKKIQFIIMFCVTVIVVILLYFFDSAPTSFRFHKLFYEESFQGIVDEIYIDTKNHNNKTIECIEIDRSHKKFKLRTPDGNQRVFDIIKHGDTIQKYSNTDFLIIHGAKKDTLRYNLKFPE